MNAVAPLCAPARASLRQRMGQFRRRVLQVAGASHHGSDIILLSADALAECWADRPDNEEPMRLVETLRAIAPRYAGPTPRAPQPANQAPVTWAELYVTARRAAQALTLRLGHTTALRLLDDLLLPPGAGRQGQHECLPGALAAHLGPRDVAAELLDALAVSIAEGLQLREARTAEVLALLAAAKETL